MSALNPKNFRAPYITREECWEMADKFRGRYWPSGTVPVDTMEIAEIELRLRFEVIHGLREEADIDALLLTDWRTLVVDRQQYMDSRFSNRLRFSIAHELGHFALHKDAFKNIPRTSSRDWIDFIQEIPEDQYSFLEYHANEFAGRLLIPVEQLRTSFEEKVLEAEAKGLQRNELTDGHLTYFCGPLARQFAVSAEVIEKRLIRERLWPL